MPFIYGGVKHRAQNMGVAENSRHARLPTCASDPFHLTHEILQTAPITRRAGDRHCSRAVRRDQAAMLTASLIRPTAPDQTPYCHVPVFIGAIASHDSPPDPPSMLRVWKFVTPGFERLEAGDWIFFRLMKCARTQSIKGLTAVEASTLQQPSYTLAIAKAPFSKGIQTSFLLPRCHDIQATLITAF